MNEPSALFLYFSAYSLIGWICETIYCSCLFKKFTNRGFLNGPFCPVYGFGALILLYLLQNVPRNIALVFFSGLLITTTLEYLTGFLLEKLFHAKWWDYSQNRFNIQGRICLWNSIMFGALSVLLIFIMHPAAIRIVMSIHPSVRGTISLVLLLYFLTDFFVTVKSMQSLNLRLAAISKALATAKEKLDVTGFYNALGISQRLERLYELLDTEKGKRIYSSIESMWERIRQLEDDNKVFQARIIRAFPNLRSTRYPEVMGILKEKILHTKKQELDEVQQDLGEEKSD